MADSFDRTIGVDERARQAKQPETIEKVDLDTTVASLREEEVASPADIGEDEDQEDEDQETGDQEDENQEAHTRRPLQIGKMCTPILDSPKPPSEPYSHPVIVQDQIEKLKDRHKSLKTTNESLTLNVNVLEARNATLEVALVQKDSKIRALKANLAKAKVDKAELRAKVTIGEGRIANLSESLRESKERKRELEGRIKKLRREADEAMT